MWAWLLFKLFGPCAFPGGKPCDQPGTQLYHTHPNSRPVYLCAQHKAEVTSESRKGE